MRLPARLRGRLALHARRTKMPRSHVVVRALERFLDEAGEEQRAAEARRQSRVASAGSNDRAWADAEGDAWPSR
jgi:predicted DNA-binding protein